MRRTILETAMAAPCGLLNLAAGKAAYPILDIMHGRSYDAPMDRIQFKMFSRACCSVILCDLSRMAITTLRKPGRAGRDVVPLSLSTDPPTPIFLRGVPRGERTTEHIDHQLPWLRQIAN